MTGLRTGMSAAVKRAQPESSPVQEQRAQMEGRVPLRKLHHALQQLTTELTFSNNQISDLQHHLKRTCRRWADEDKQQHLEVFNLQTSSSNLLSSSLPLCHVISQKKSQHQSDSVTNPEKAYEVLRQHSPQIASDNDSTKVIHQQSRPRIDFQVSSSGLWYDL